MSKKAKNINVKFTIGDYHSIVRNLNLRLLEQDQVIKEQNKKLKVAEGMAADVAGLTKTFQNYVAQLEPLAMDSMALNQAFQQEIRSRIVSELDSILDMISLIKNLWFVTGETESCRPIAEVIHNCLLVKDIDAKSGMGEEFCQDFNYHKELFMEKISTATKAVELSEKPIEEVSEFVELIETGFDEIREYLGTITNTIEEIEPIQIEFKPLDLPKGLDKIKTASETNEVQEAA